MTYLALSLYALGLIGACAAVNAGPRKWIVCLLWPLAVAACTAWGIFDAFRAVANAVRGRA